MFLLVAPNSPITSFKQLIERAKAEPGKINFGIIGGGSVYQLLEKCQGLARSQSGRGKRKKFRFKNKLMSLDATVIGLCASAFDWAQYQRTKGAANCTCCWIMRGICPVSR